MPDDTSIRTGSAGNLAGRDVHNYQDPTQPVLQQGERFEASRQLERLETRLGVLADELFRVRQDLAVTVAQMSGIRDDFKERIDALTLGLARVQADVTTLKEAVYRLTDKVTAPPRGLSNTGLAALLAFGLVIVVILVALTMYSLLRTA